MRTGMSQFKTGSMVFFKKEKDKIKAEVSEVSKNKIAEGIAGAGLKIQAIFSGHMNALFVRMSPKGMKIVLIVFCLCGGGFSIYLVNHAIINPQLKTASFKLDRMNVPKHYDQTGDESIRQDVQVDEQTYNQLQRFTVYMDSLKIKNKNIYDSILQARPGLMDSVQMLVGIYDSQKIK